MSEILMVGQWPESLTAVSLTLMVLELQELEKNEVDRVVEVAYN